MKDITQLTQKHCVMIKAYFSYMNTVKQSVIRYHQSKIKHLIQSVVTAVSGFSHCLIQL